MEILHRHGIGYCAKCPNRDHCVVLCSRAEAYVGQDYVAQIEITIGLPMIETKEEMVSESYEPVYTAMEKAIFTLIGRGKSRKKICQLLEITNESLRTHIKNIRKKTSQSYI